MYPTLFTPDAETAADAIKSSLFVAPKGVLLHGPPGELPQMMVQQALTNCSQGVGRPYLHERWQKSRMRRLSMFPFLYSRTNGTANRTSLLQPSLV